MQNNIYSVTKLNNEIKGLLEGNTSFRNIFVQGELSNFKAHSSGHLYMTLKDENAAISTVMFRTDVARLRFRPENGMKVIARGRVSSFPKSGQVQIYIADMMPAGAGALQIAFEQLKEKLYAEGLFDANHKRPIPHFPETIAIITSPTGAAVQDMLRILARRWPVARVQIYPALVQGAAAPQDLCRALSEVNERAEGNLVIIGRGGGSMEDLWAFNDEKVARAIYHSKIPTVSAVGHEPDVTIADFVADLRASTPSGAAEQVTPDGLKLRTFLTQMEASLQNSMQHRLLRERQHLSVRMQRLSLRAPYHSIQERRLLLEHCAERLMWHSPQNIILKYREKCAIICEKITVNTQNAIDVKRNNLSENIAKLDAISPLKVLARGYAVALRIDGTVVHDSRSIAEGDTLRIQFSKGCAVCNVLETRENHE